MKPREIFVTEFENSFGQWLPFHAFNSKEKAHQDAYPRGRVIHCREVIDEPSLERGQWWCIEASGDGSKRSKVISGTIEDVKHVLAEMMFFGPYEEAIKDEFVSHYLNLLENEDHWSHDFVWYEDGEQCYFRVSRVDEVVTPRTKQLEAQLREAVLMMTWEGDYDEGKKWLSRTKELLEGK